MNLTLNMIRAQSPCHEGWIKLLTTLGKTKADDDPLNLLTVLDSNGLDCALWVLAHTDCYKRLYRHFSAWCAEQFLPIFESQFPDDTRPRNAIAIARDDTATDQDRAAARADAWDAVSVSLAAWDAAWDASRAVWDARDAERAALDASRDAWDAHNAHVAAVFAWDAVGGARDTVEDDTCDVRSDAGTSERAAQSAQLRKMLTEGF